MDRKVKGFGKVFEVTLRWEGKLCKWTRKWRGQALYVNWKVRGINSRSGLESGMVAKLQEWSRKWGQALLMEGASFMRGLENGEWEFQK